LLLREIVAFCQHGGEMMLEIDCSLRRSFLGIAFRGAVIFLAAGEAFFAGSMTISFLDRSRATCSLALDSNNSAYIHD
jgi:hypothetical protein